MGSTLHLWTGDEQAIEFQRHLLKVMREGWVEVPQNGYVYALSYFGGRRHLAYALVGSHKKIKNLLKVASQHHGVGAVAPGLPPKSIFETLDVVIRRRAVLIMQKLLQGWPDEFIAFSRAYKIERDVWDRRQPELPFWHWKVIHLNLKKTRYQPTEQEFSSILNFIRKTGREPSRSELCKYLNPTVVPNIDFKKKDFTTKLTKSTKSGRKPIRSVLIALRVLRFFVVSFS